MAELLITRARLGEGEAVTSSAAGFSKHRTRKGLAPFSLTSSLPAPEAILEAAMLGSTTRSPVPNQGRQKTP